MALHEEGISESTLQFEDNRSEAIIQRRRQEMANNSPQATELARWQAMANNYVAQQPTPIQRVENHITKRNKLASGQENRARYSNIEANPTQSVPLQPKTNENAGPISDIAGVIQRKASVTVQNTTDAYVSEWVKAESQSKGVEAGPRAEAQKVKAIAGGNWVGGHMINDRLGGGGGFDNIVPITNTMNNHHHTIENKAQRIVGDGTGPYEVRYYMNILNREDYDLPKGEVKNLPNKFKQSYEYRTKEVQAGGSRSRPVPYQAPGDSKSEEGKELDMKVG